MITLSTTLTAAQKTLSYRPVWKLVLSRAAQSTRGYDTSRVLRIHHTEEPNSYKAEVELQNYDNALTGIDFEAYQGVISYGIDTGVSRSAWVAGSSYAVDDFVRPTAANGLQYRCAVAGTAAGSEPAWPTVLGVRVADSTVTWEMDGNAGMEYIRRVPMKVVSQQMPSQMGRNTCILSLMGDPDVMGMEAATSDYSLQSGDTQTVKTLITAVAGATYTPFTAYPAHTVTYDSEDGLLDTYKPQDGFITRIGGKRWDKIRKLLDDTGSYARMGNDGNIHVLDPVVSGTAYAYEYKFDTSGEHTFFLKNLRNRLVVPNKVIVKTHDDMTPAYSGSAQSSSSFALIPIIETRQLRVSSSAQASSIAVAIIEKAELDAERASAVVPPNVGQEIYDYIKVTDSRQANTTVTGNVQHIGFDCSSRMGIFRSDIRFGRLGANQVPIPTSSVAAVPAVDLTKVFEWMTKVAEIVNALAADLEALKVRVENNWEVFVMLWKEVGDLYDRLVYAERRMSREIIYVSAGPTQLTTSKSVSVSSLNQSTSGKLTTSKQLSVA